MLVPEREVFSTIGMVWVWVKTPERCLTPAHEPNIFESSIYLPSQTFHVHHPMVKLELRSTFVRKD